MAQVSTFLFLLLRAFKVICNSSTRGPRDAWVETHPANSLEPRGGAAEATGQPSDIMLVLDCPYRPPPVPFGLEPGTWNLEPGQPWSILHVHLSQLSFAFLFAFLLGPRCIR